MAASEILGLFTSPQQYQQNQLAQFQNRAFQEVQLDPFQQAALGARTAGYQLAQGVGGALGGQDPQLQLIARRQQLSSQLDQSNPDSYLQVAKMAAQSGDPQFAMAIADAGRQLQTSMATTRKATAEAEKVELSNAQETQLRSELSKLVNPTEAEILAIVTKYGSPDKVLTALQASADKAKQRELLTAQQTEKLDAEARNTKEKLEAKSEQSRKDNEAKLERLQERIDAEAKAAKERGATASMLKTMEINGRKEIQAIKNEFKQSELLNKPLAPSLQKDEGKDLELVDSLFARAESLAPAIKLLTIDPTTKKAPLELGPLNNLKYLGQNAAGNSTTESRAYAELQRAVQAATNLKTDAAKGVQTDKDVLRFANELIAAFGANDTKTSLEALNNFYKSTKKAEEDTKKRIDSRRVSQGVQPYYGATSGTAKNPIKLD
jgi:hypothetical protein